MKNKKASLRLYRGLTARYRPERVGKGNPAPWVYTDFTDCPYTALSFARGTRGSLLVLDVPTAAMDPGEAAGVRVTRGLWGLNGEGPQRFMVWGKFDEFLVAEIPAAVVRAAAPRKTVVSLPEEEKSEIVKLRIEEILHGEKPLPQNLDRAVRGHGRDPRKLRP